MHLVNDLAKLILSYLSIKQLQLFEQNEAFGLTKTKLITINGLSTILVKKYGLNKNQINKYYTKLINNNYLTPIEAFTNIASLNGDVGYEAQIYITIKTALLYAIKQKDLQLVIYYIGRSPLFLGATKIRGALLYYAILSDNMDIVKAVCTLFNVNLGMLAKMVGTLPTLLLCKNVINYIVNNISDKTLLTRLSVLKFYSNTKSTNYDNYINYVYLNNKLTLNQILELAEPVLLINYVKTTKLTKIVMDCVKPRYFYTYNIYSKYHTDHNQSPFTFDHNRLPFVFDSSQLKRVVELKQLILTHFIDTANREYYINCLNVLLNQSITFNLVTIVNQFDKLFISFVLSVLHSQAINIIIDNKIVIALDPIQINFMGLPDLTSLMLSTIVYDAKAYKKILPSKQSIDKFYIIKLNILLSGNYAKISNQTCKLAILRDKNSRRRVRKLQITDYETMVHLNEECQQNRSEILSIPNIYVARQFAEDPQLAKYYKGGANLYLTECAKIYDQNLATFDLDTLRLNYNEYKNI